jgi:hypothetical protein
MDHRLIHDAASQMAKETLRAVKDCLFEHEHHIAFEEFYYICKQNLEAYELEVERIRQRLVPSQN